MISAENAIRTFRRDVTIASLLRGLLFAAGVGTTFMAMSSGGKYLLIPVGVVIALGMFLAIRSARKSQMTADSTSLIASGQFDEAEEQIQAVLGSFWLLRSVKLLGLHHLAVLRHAQRQWRDSALLSRALLGQRLGALPGVARTTRLMLADSLLELNDLRGAYEALASLYSQQLTLVEAMNLLVVQLDYESKIGAWDAMFRSVGYKVQLAELMPAGPAARTQAMLALAAQKIGRTDWADWLRRRTELLIDPEEMLARRPLLKAVWGENLARNPNDEIRMTNP